MSMGRRAIVIITGILMASFFLAAQQPDYDRSEPSDQPGQPVARLGVMNGDVSVRRGDSGEWIAAALNAPLLAGDSISVGPGGSAEMQLDFANFVRIGGDSEIRISELESGRSQIQVAHGILTWRVLRESNAQSEISTPSAAIHPLRLAAVRTEVSLDGSTRIIVRKGEAEISSPRGNEPLREGNMMLLRGNPGDAEFQVVYAPARDGWDTWNDQRDAWLERAQSPRYVSQDIYGTEDLDQYGRWGYDAAYGNVWTPSVPDTWAPYRNGQWVWEDYYGWTWVDNDPWGWAPFHYGNWYFRTGYGWSWFPGQRYAHSWWHPALVGFVGFGGGYGVGFGFSNVGWIPLAPFEPYHPWYGRGWYGGRYPVVPDVNIVRNVNVYNTYRNARFSNGVTAVSAGDFQRGVFRNNVAVDRGQLQQASLVRGAVPVAPTASNLRFSDRSVSPASVPRGTVANQRFFSRMPSTGSAQRTPFSQQQASVRSAFEGARGGGFNNGSSGWQRFGEPTPSRGGSAAGRAGWDGFGAPQAQRFSQAPPPQARPAYPNSRPSESRSLQVAPPMVQQRQAQQRQAQPRQAPAPSYNRSAPSGGSRGNGGGAHASSGRR
jgi:hypothetical protein